MDGLCRELGCRGHAEALRQLVLLRRPIGRAHSPAGAEGGADGGIESELRAELEPLRVAVSRSVLSQKGRCDAIEDALDDDQPKR